ncbi:MAG TPA: hypothetical protein VEB69_05725 [Acidimicrobiia bacterium]|nr:hypothetical protein [Acidimicrobiia bacterium]
MDTRYVDELIGPDTVTTLSEDTITAFEEHGTIARTVDQATDEAANTSAGSNNSASTSPTLEPTSYPRASNASAPTIERRSKASTRMCVG